MTGHLTCILCNIYPCICPTDRKEAERLARLRVINRCVHNSPPPLDDVGGCSEFDFDEFDPYNPYRSDDMTTQQPFGEFSYDEFSPMPLPPTRPANVEQPYLGPNMMEMNGESHVAFVEDLNPHVVAANRGPSEVTDAILAARKTTHGPFQLNARHGQQLRNFFRGSPGWVLATDREREALEYIAGKLSRILSGSPGYSDHWNDIAGYATLAANPDMQR